MSSGTRAAQLRAGLNNLFSEHSTSRARPPTRHSAGARRSSRRRPVRSTRTRWPSPRRSAPCMAGRRDGVPVPVAPPHRLRRRLHGRRRQQRHGQAGHGGQRSRQLHAGLRRVPELGEPESAEVSRRRPREASRGHAQERHRRQASKDPARAYTVLRAKKAHLLRWCPRLRVSWVVRLWRAGGGSRGRSGCKCDWFPSRRTPRRRARPDPRDSRRLA